MGGLGDPETVALGERDEDVEEVARELDVVVDDQQPVEAARRVGGQRGVEVRPLAGALGGRDDPQQRVVVRGPELVPDLGRRARVLGRTTESDEHASRRLRARLAARAAAACASCADVRPRVAQPPGEQPAPPERARAPAQVVGVARAGAGPSAGAAPRAGARA